MAYSRVTRAVLGITALSAALTSACGDRDTIAAPSSLSAPLPRVPTGPLVTLSGQVKDPAGNPVTARVHVFPLRFSDAWTGAWGRSSETNASGQYQLSAPLHRDTAYVRAYKEGYIQQCAAAVILDADATADLLVTDSGTAQLSGLPRVPNTRHVSGTVYENRNGDRRPVSDVWVGWEPLLDTVLADTITDSAGRYRLCGLPTDRHADTLFAVRLGGGRSVWASIEAGGDAVIDFEVP